MVYICPRRQCHLRTYDAIITSLWRQSDVTTSFSRQDDVIIALYARLGTEMCCIRSISQGYIQYFTINKVQIRFKTCIHIVQFGTCDLWKYHHNFAVGNQTNTCSSNQDRNWHNWFEYILDLIHMIYVYVHIHIYVCVCVCASWFKHCTEKYIKSHFFIICKFGACSPQLDGNWYLDCV